MTDSHPEFFTSFSQLVTHVSHSILGCTTFRTNLTHQLDSKHRQMTAEQQAKNSNMNRADRAEEELKKSRKVNKKLIADNKRLEANCQNLLSGRV